MFKLFSLSVLAASMAASATLGASQFSWQEPHAKVLPTGDLEWAPQAFNYQAGKAVRYIDYESGDDSNPGTREQPWKHHPWDPQASGNAKADSEGDTYVFKQGVTYRGALAQQNVAGENDQPIRLTVDPNWGKGEAVIAGSMAPMIEERIPPIDVPAT